MNDPGTKLKDLIHVERGAITPDLCDYIIKDIETREWEKHSWYNLNEEVKSEDTKELDVQYITSDLQYSLLSIMNHVASSYVKEYSYKQSYRTQNIMSIYSPIRFNRYSNGQTMRHHHDHIHSLFDGVDKGIGGNTRPGSDKMYYGDKK